ncbi:MAG: hypothetical protein L3J24_08405, partial [Xanthomonadales bacterium]|nr:hypothetical protein [Xanthomonadales bacterium]
HHLSPEELAKNNFSFQDKRLSEMLFRYRARNYPETLNPEEKEIWDAFRTKRILQGDMGNQMTHKDYLQRITELRQEINQTEGDHQEKLALMDKLEVWPLEIGINP